MQTISLRGFEAAVRAIKDELGFETRAGGVVDETLAECWRAPSAARRRFEVLAAPGVSRGFIRVVEGPRDDETATFHKRGLFNAEILTRDVEALFARLQKSRGFDIVSELNTYDLSGAGGGAISRSFATRGPGGAGFFFTQYLKVPPPRTLPACATLVGPMFNAAISTPTREGPVESFYQGVLGINRRLAGRLTQPTVNRIIGLPDDWGFTMLVFKGEGDGLIEVDVHEHDVPQEPVRPEGELRPGNSMLTVETEEIDAIVARARAAGWPARDALAIAAAPYADRRAVLLRGPAGESVEVVGA